MVPGLFKRQQADEKPKYRKDTTPSQPFATAQSIEDKIKEIIAARRFEAYQEDVRRARVYYKVELFYRGYQNLGPWDDELFSYPVYDDEPTDFAENRFRRNALILAGLLIKMEPTPVIRPGSEDPMDLEAALANEKALEIIHENIGYDQLKAEKSLIKVLFGNAFIYSDYQVDRRFGTIMVPKFKYDVTSLPGAAMCPNGQCGMVADEGTPTCPQCGMPMNQVPSAPIETQIPNGFDQKTRGQEFSIVCSPLEVKMRAKCKGGLENQPYLLWITKEDIDQIKYVYPDLDVKPQGASQHYGTSGTAEYENALRYQDILAALPGNIWGGVRPYWATTNYFDQVDVIRAWINPQLYKNDPELLKEAPDGFAAIQVEGELAEWRPERMTDHWTHEKYIINPHSSYGDGLFDPIPLQRALNTINQLLIRHLEYDTIPLRLFDTDMIVKEDISNDPAKKWIECNITPEKGLDKAVRDLPPQQLSIDVPNFKMQVYEADKDVSGATDPVAGQVAGANTPYSAQVLANEQGQVRHLPSLYYNSSAVRSHTLQLLKIAELNWIDPRKQTTIDPTTGKPSSVSITGADLSRGEISVKVMTNDFKPKTRGEIMTALQYAATFGIDPTATPKQRLRFFEYIGLDPEGDMIDTQTRRAYRVIEKIKSGQQVQPDVMIDDGNIQGPAIQEYLASKAGEDLMISNQVAFQSIRQYMVTVQTMAMMKAQSMAAMTAGAMPPGGHPLAPGMPPTAGKPGGGGPPPAKPNQPPGGQPGQTPGGPKPQMAQSPVPPGQQQPMPAMPNRP